MGSSPATPTEVGEKVPDLETLIAIANFFHVSLDYLAGLSDVKQQIRQSDLTADELEYLYAYRQLGNTDKEKVKSYIDGLQSRA